MEAYCRLHEIAFLQCLGTTFSMTTLLLFVFENPLDMLMPRGTEATQFFRLRSLIVLYNKTPALILTIFSGYVYLIWNWIMKGFY